ncbi:hypothetical protein J7L48_04540, partial [bacterium]|nr:hypothetical protein [bacterium]
MMENVNNKRAKLIFFVSFFTDGIYLIIAYLLSSVYHFIPLLQDIHPLKNLRAGFIISFIVIYLFLRRLN